MQSLKLFLEIFGGLIILFSIIPLIKNDYWAFRVFEYPRLQKLFLNLAVLIVYISLFAVSTPFQYVFLAALLANTGYLIFQIYKFTFLSKKVLLKASKSDEKNQVSIISSNVFQDNKNTSGCLKMLHKHDPDIILLLETDEFWYKGTEELKEKYPHQVLVPLNNTYGMLLYSKLELIDSEVRYLVDEEIPSIKTEVKLPSGQKVRLYCVHPTPPVPGENSYSTERDKELLLVAKEVKENSFPTIVVGDLNDVAWSYTTELFTKISGLLDPRRGRGFFNTFHAKYPFLRFPLDHLFCSTDFKLIRIMRLENFNSDHFPILIELQYEKNADLHQEEPQADGEDIALAEEKINKETDQD
ncbi:endonuclease/exonuclease/phosphatase family protein [Dyadobacter sp. CY345]|uniref:endonuclease/exonuclease/phosphatase family protein n=1 Tax=Dyadobacter sp. CY345 TaxID=2909335 RepID=UPI001F29B1C2|nr:endonuclease/exonuclease/phosphatase family protein [Dyadobacter sp. CY345]MCF2443689.1 endonuclease/exonuclease/phosphatase family protein [Dyadobacter sp. CY345]